MERLRFIKGVRQLGLSLGEIAEILALRERGAPPCSYVSERLERRAEAIDRQIAQLVQLKDALTELRRRARRLPPRTPAADGYCHILEHRAR